jgi:AcrR family transcriptional regulator
VQSVPERRRDDVEAAPPRLRRAERRAQIVAAATRAFARAGFAATNLDDVAGEAGVSRVILYRHFDSKADLYRAVLDQVSARLAAACGDGDYSAATIPALVGAAAEDPDGFRLLFHHAAREPEFHAEMDEFRATMTAVARAQLADQVPDPAWAGWAAQLTPVVVVEAIIAWLDAGRPDPDEAAARIGRAVDAVIEAASPSPARDTRPATSRRRTTNHTTRSARRGPVD